MTSELFRQSARAVRELLRRSEITPTDLVECAICRIEAFDAKVNAIPIRCFERARAQAERLTRSLARGEQAPFLGGIPLVIKDNCDVGGVRTTSGTPIFADRIAEQSDRAVAVMEANGGIPIGKSNLSELGGASTSNTVLGTTLNPWNTQLSCGGPAAGRRWRWRRGKCGSPMATMSAGLCASRQASAALLGCALPSDVCRAAAR